MVALGRVVFRSREHVIALEPRGKGLLGVTLRHAGDRSIDLFVVPTLTFARLFAFLVLGQR